MIKKILSLFLNEEKIYYLFRKKIDFGFFWKKSFPEKIKIYFLLLLARISTNYSKLFIQPTNRAPQIIVSFTSIPPRFSQLHLVIQSILRQSLLPDRLVLWLSKEHKRKEFGQCTLKTLPKKVQKLQKHGLEIYFTKDIGSYRKLLPSLKKFPDDIIITIDDDILYENNIIEDLYNAYLHGKKQAVYCKRSRIINRTNKNEKIKYIADVLNFTPENNDKNLFFTSGSGTLFSPHILHKDVFREDIFSKLAPYEDDSWYNIMLRLNKKTVVIQLSSKEILRLSNSYKYALLDINTSKYRAKFNEQFNNLIQYYKITF